MENSERKKQLEEKKQKLAALKERKKAQEEAKKAKLLQHMEKRGDKLDASGSSSALLNDEEMAKIMVEVGLDPSPKKLDTPVTGRDRDASPAAQPRQLFQSSRPTTLSVQVPVGTQVNIAPKESVAYSKTTQTSGDAREFKGVSVEGTPSHDFEWEDGFETQLGGGGRKHTRAGTMDEGSEVSDLSPTAHVPPELAGLVSSIIRSAEGGTVVGEGDVLGSKEASEEPRAPAAELSEEEKAKVLASPDFQAYFQKATGILERALADPYEEYIFREVLPEAAVKTDTGAKVSLAHTFSHPLVEKKYVMGLEFSETHPELVAVAYGDESAGAAVSQSFTGSYVLVWNVKLPNKASPEHILHSMSKLTAIAWSRFHPHLLIGGTYSGQICLWDRRQMKRTPVQRSPLSATAHTHPVYGLRVVGTQNANNLVSLSKDGRLCTWSLDMLAQPLQVIDLTAKQSRQEGWVVPPRYPHALVRSAPSPLSRLSDEVLHQEFSSFLNNVNGQCLDFPSQEVNNFLVGAEDGGLYQGCRHGQKPGITETFDPHAFLVSSLRCHRAQGPVDFSHLFLTGSFDWSVRLHSTKEAKALHSCDDHTAFVLDVAWSPTHPALFANSDASGLLEIWDLNADTELPAATLLSEGRVGLPKIQWSPAGNQLVVGTAQGALCLYDIHESLASPKTDAWARFSRTLLELKKAAEETKELGEVFAATSALPAR